MIIGNILLAIFVAIATILKLSLEITNFLGLISSQNRQVSTCFFLFEKALILAELVMELKGFWWQNYRIRDKNKAIK